MRESGGSGRATLGWEEKQLFSEVHLVAPANNRAESEELRVKHAIDSPGLGAIAVVRGITRRIELDR